MAQDSFKAKKSLNIQPRSDLSLTEQGDLGVDLSDGRLKYHNGTLVQDVLLTEDAFLPGFTEAVNVNYDPAVSGLTATNVQDAIDETVAEVDSVASLLQAHINDTSGAHAASAISNVPAGNIVATDVQAAINELDTEKADAASTAAAIALKADIASPVFTGNPQAPTPAPGDNDTTIATTAFVTAAVAAAPGGVTSVFGRTGAVVQVAGDYTGTQVTNTPAGGIAATNVQAAINELDTEKANLASPTFTGVPAAPTAAVGTNTTQLATTAFVLANASAGGINWITPSDGISATGYNVYADAAGTQPVDGTGGSPTVTIASSTTNPLHGTASYLFTKPASNVQGQGWSKDFTIDSGYINSPVPQKITMLAKVSSGTYADGDMTFWIIDTTSGQVIQPSAYRLLNASGAQQLMMEFQPNFNSGNYRLCGHVSSTSTSAYTIQLDDISVSPNTYTSGAAVTDVVSFTPTGSFNTNTTYTGSYIRVGAIAKVKIQLAFSGAPNSTNLSVNLPFSIDTSKLLNTSSGAEKLGEGRAIDSGVNTAPLVVTYASSNSVNVYNTVTNTGANPVIVINTNNVSNVTPFSFGSGDSINLDFEVPVLGWGTSQVLSSETSTRLISAQAACTTSFVTGPGVPINFNNVFVDRGGAITTSVSAWRFTAPVSGDYFLQASGISASGGATFVIYKNGIAIQDLMSVTSAAVTNGSAIISLNAGEYFDLRAGNTLTLLATSRTNVISVYRLSGPAQIAASETVACNAVSTGVQTITASVSQVTSLSVLSDTHGAFSSNQYVIPSPGRYRISYNQLFSNVASPVAGLSIWKNGTIQVQGPRSDLSGTQLLGLTVSGTLRCITGDIITFRAFSSTSVNLQAVAEDNQIFIERIGN